MSGRSYDDLAEQFLKERSPYFGEALTNPREFRCSLERLADSRWDGRVATIRNSPADLKWFHYAILRHSLSETPQALAVWRRLEWERHDRDDTVRSVVAELTDWMAEQPDAFLARHQEFFFNWHLARYRVDLARSSFHPPHRGLAGRFIGSLARYVHYGVFVVVAAATIVSFTANQRWIGWLSLAVFLLAVLLQLLASRPGRVAGGSAPENGMNRSQQWRARTIAACQSLVPRLAGTAAVGLLFVFSVRSALLSQGSILPSAPTSQLVAWTATVTAVSAGYLFLEVVHRVRPTPGSGVFGTRVLPTLSVGAAHALMLTWMALPILQTDDLRLCVVEFVALASTVLAIGMVLNIIWSDPPTTTPL